MKKRLYVLLSILPFIGLTILAVRLFQVQTASEDVASETREAPSAADNGALPPPSTPEPDPLPTLEQVAVEVDRLESLKATLAEVQSEPVGKTAPTAAVDGHIERTNQRIRELESQLNEAKAAPSETAVVSGETPPVDVAGDARQQVQEVDEQILELQARVRLAETNAETDPNAGTTLKELNNQLTALRTQREELNTQARSSTPTAEPAGAGAPGTPVAGLPTPGAPAPARVASGGAREELERQLGDLRADLDYWQSQKQGGGAEAQAARVDQLEAQIRDQEERVNAMKQMGNTPTSVQ